MASTMLVYAYTAWFAIAQQRQARRRGLDQTYQFKGALLALRQWPAPLGQGDDSIMRFSLDAIRRYEYVLIPFPETSVASEQENTLLVEGS